MDSALTTVGLPLALAIIMFGLGLDLMEGYRENKTVTPAPPAKRRSAPGVSACELEPQGIP